MSRGVQRLLSSQNEQFSGVYVSWGDGGPVVGSDFSEKPPKRQDGTKQGPFSRCNAETVRPVDVPPITRRRFCRPTEPHTP